MNLNRHLVRFALGLSCLTAVTCLGWLWQTLAAAQPANPPPAPRPALKLADSQTLGGADRYLTYLSTDKPIYRAGETVFVRGVVLHQASHRPLPAGPTTPAVIEIRGPKGDVVASGQANAEDSVLGFQWTVPEGQAGGQADRREARCAYHQVDEGYLHAVAVVDEAHVEAEEAEYADHEYNRVCEPRGLHTRRRRRAILFSAHH